MTLTATDWTIATVTLVGAVGGVVFGLSGAFAFLVASAASAFAGKACWKFAGGWFDQSWQCVLATVVVSLLVFWICRAIVRRLVGRILAQPADAIFGAVLGAAVAFALALASAWGLSVAGALPGHSTILNEVSGLVG